MLRAGPRRSIGGAQKKINFFFAVDPRSERFVVELTPAFLLSRATLPCESSSCDSTWPGTGRNASSRVP